MKLKRLALVTVTVMSVLLPSAAQAAQWVEVARSNDGNTHAYVDKQSIKRRGNTVQYWTYWVNYLLDGRTDNAYKELNETNCASDNYRVLRTVIYDNGRVQSDTKENRTLAATPGTVLAGVLDSVCGR